MYNNHFLKRNVAVTGRRNTKDDSAPEQREQIPNIYKSDVQDFASRNPMGYGQCSFDLKETNPSPLNSEIIKLILSSGQSFFSGFNSSSGSSPDFEFQSIYTSGSVTLCLRKRNRAMVDLVGIEPNPGPASKATKKLVTSILNSGMVTQKKKKKKSTSTNRSAGASRRNLNGVGAGNMLTSAPASFGFVAPKSYFRSSGNVQKLASQDARSGVRVEGCALFGSSINVLSTSSLTSNGGFSGAGTANLGFAFITPAATDPRLASIAQTFQWNAIRKMVVRWIPSTATTTSGTIFLGIAKDAYEASIAYNAIGAATPSAGTPQGVLDYDPSVMSTIWQSAMMDFSHTGTQLWETFGNDAEPVVERIQAAFVAIVSSAVASGVNTGFGNLWVEYVWDFYVPGAPLGAN
jgi:hypothetical protein